ncbi:hypothetical protein HY992_03375 [Candidatus Micrarchaeota archaeon]|nr:hypothetical protein [Candidatus Micrarchaeota archaeon]
MRFNSQFFSSASILLLSLLFFSLLSTALDCSSFYSPYSVTVKSFEAEKPVYFASETLKATFTAVNTFSTPLQNVSFVALVRKDGVVFGQQSFTTASLQPNASTSSSIYWKIPRGAPQGEYSLELYTYASTFPVGGDTANPGSSVGTASFNVENKFEDYVAITSAGVKNGKLELEVSGAGSDAPAVIIFEVFYGNEQKHAKLSKLFKEGKIPSGSKLGKAISATSAANTLLNKNNLLALSSNASLTLTRELPLLPSGSYAIKATIIKQDSKSIAFIPLKTGDSSEILFLSPSSFPFSSEGNFASACVSTASNSSLSLRVSAEGSKPESTNEKISASAINQHVSLQFNASPSSRKLSIEASLYNENNSLSDYASVSFESTSFETQTLLSLNASAVREKISYALTVSDELGNPAQATVDLLVYKDGQLVEILQGLKASGTLSTDYIANETGEYTLTALIPETQQQASADANVSEIPLGLQLLQPSEPAPASKPQIDFIPLLVIVLLFLSVILAFFFYKASKK